MDTQSRVLQLFKDSEAILHGHFSLTSGRHSDTYMQCAKLFEIPSISEEICKLSAEELKSLDFDCVVSPAVGAIIYGYELAKQLNKPNLFAERGADGKFTLRRGFELKKGTKVVVAENVVTTGGSVFETIDLIKELGCTVVAVASVVDRSNGKVDFGVPFKALLPIEVISYEANDCPLCKEGKPVVKPGSKGLK